MKLELSLVQLSLSMLAWMGAWGESGFLRSLAIFPFLPLDRDLYWLVWPSHTSGDLFICIQAIIAITTITNNTTSNTNKSRWSATWPTPWSPPCSPPWSPTSSPPPSYSSQHQNIIKLINVVVYWDPLGSAKHRNTPAFSGKNIIKHTTNTQTSKQIQTHTYSLLCTQTDTQIHTQEHGNW